MKTHTDRMKSLVKCPLKRLLAIAFLTLILLALPAPVFAADLPTSLPTDLPVNAASSEPAGAATGAKVFEIHCAGCHLNGGNIVRRGKNLKLKTLQKNQMDSIVAIAEIVTNGKNNMSAYRDRLTEPQIQEVAAYVLKQAEQNWK
jgi:cytochrome c6